MRRWNALSDLPDDLSACAVTLGNFDGVHRGHRAVLEQLVAQARAVNATAVAVTFDPHPVSVLRPEQAPPLLGTLDQRLELLGELGLDAVLVMEFTRDLATWTPEEFVRRVFVEALHARLVVVGQDTRFGVRNSGDVETLRGLGEKFGFEVAVVSDQGGQTHATEVTRWSSSQARSLVVDGDVEAAADVLGRRHEVAGTVVHGDHRGRELGYPTANLCQDPDGLIPADGVYAGWLVRGGGEGERLPAAISVGTNPTFDGTQRRVEAYVLDRTDLDLYGERVGLEFVQRLRPMYRFGDIEELLTVMGEDVRRTRELLGVQGPQV
ncbi:riboflavin kinase / FMN adenylyltransferase [Austwickia chelonae]|uniref:Riboflavin biosynthesis protein n=1 Tax=Austwickia chelonae NBRC 105200 TaxID=1184607 RepID=K6UKM5_9MICO|nr:bifunctional riboflavin kinase/FAD synthetase [Austwickia chelonae]GAB76506.1 putative riboflavin kinase [Austwickia chelonae NBRC 105200]SEW25895.1 riboflavin kinase / FMN adenylyltransferase [Austwickia chelonae]